MLKEKQQHIEQLLKERDLERAEITKAASLADEAEQRYVSIQKEFENVRRQHVYIQNYLYYHSGVVFFSIDLTAIVN